MNHLAHLFLAPDSPEARVGSILGDFAQGIDLAKLPDEVHRGVRHHLRVDAYTDQHTEVRASKRCFSPMRRRFAGIALDVLYDHFLLRHWQCFSEDDPDSFIARVYRELESHGEVMPASMRAVTERMVRQDWFGAYRDLDRIGYALDRISERIRFPNRFSGVIEEIKANETELESRFLIFFPELQRIAGEFE
ncbi:ACP phosphodiesterase [Marinobacter sp. F4216]|uniref:acyl carrier protein phosphodiesterase n=1 Tax=Marinobacter sp. F4216 TaxID=2874281 RepID=UPI001CC0213E|nr:ACP phosphodiesterase [Marinobacter sp. F4216]MBZ2168058.1 ACP phosphodiesterase [Marinobacter sp. F4216]